MKYSVNKRILTLLFCLATITGLYSCGSNDSDNASASLVNDIPIAYIKRTVPLDDNGDERYIDYREPFAFYPGAALMLKKRASATTDEENITGSVFPAGQAYDVKDLEVSFDGSKLLFAMRAPEIPGVDDSMQPTWNIWEYNITTKQLRRVIESNLQAEAGQDIAPAYLPDGRIVFSSTRQRDINAIRLNESKPQYAALDESGNSEAAVLHVMNSDGSNIRQITFNQSHDLDASVMQDGRLLFSRWVRFDGVDQMHLYTANPDGSNVQILYGNRSHTTGTGTTPVQFLHPVQQPDGKILAKVVPFALDHYGSNWFFIDTNNFFNVNAPVSPNMSGLTTQNALFPSLIPTENSIAVNGRYLDVTRMNDNTGRYLVAWNTCRLRIPGTTPAADEIGLLCNNDNLALPGIEEASTNAGVWVYDPQNNTQKPVTLTELGKMVTEVVPLIQRPIPVFIPDTISDEQTGVLSIASVYDRDGTDTSPNGITVMRDPLQSNYNLAPVRFIRISKGVGIPNDDTRRISGASFGPGNRFMLEILGYAPVEPDGSVKVTVPANVPFMFDLVDSNGQAIGNRHNRWLQVRPAETVHCAGCHAANNTNPHGRSDAEHSSINPGAPLSNMPFPNTDPNVLPFSGETMADTYSRLHGARTLSPDLLYTDEWTDANVTALAQNISVRYKDPLAPELDLTTAIPTSDNCLDNWTEFCRIIINYEQHIQPLWEKPRQVLAMDGVTVLEDHTCTLCHNRSDALGMVQVPAEQLELTNQSSDIETRQLISYTDLFRQDFEQVIIDSILQDRTVEEPALDGMGNPLLDENNQPIINIIRFPVNPVLSGNGARNSTEFFNKFTVNAGDSNHFGQLTAIELKLLREWLDGGAQYYNNPFDAPEL